MSETLDEVEEEIPCISPDEMARKLQISRDHVYRMVKSGVMRGQRVGRRLIIPRSELGRIVAELERKEIKGFSEFKTD